MRFSLLYIFIINLFVEIGLISLFLFFKPEDMTVIDYLSTKFPQLIVAISIFLALNYFLCTNYYGIIKFKSNAVINGDTLLVKLFVVNSTEDRINIIELICYKYHSNHNFNLLVPSNSTSEFEFTFKRQNGIHSSKSLKGELRYRVKGKSIAKKLKIKQ